MMTPQTWFVVHDVIHDVFDVGSYLVVPSDIFGIVEYKLYSVYTYDNIQIYIQLYVY